MHKAPKLPQDDIARRRRLNEGRCSTHGHPLIILEVDHDGLVCDCPDPACDFSYVAKPGSKVATAVLKRKRSAVR